MNKIIMLSMIVGLGVTGVYGAQNLFSDSESKDIVVPIIKEEILPSVATHEETQTEIKKEEIRIPTESTQMNFENPCVESKTCISGEIVNIVDGDTLDLDNIRIRLALVNTPEKGDAGYHEATKFTGEICPVGSTAYFDEDDLQLQGSYGRKIGTVDCQNGLINQKLLDAGYAEILTKFCSKSEFSGTEWAKNYGC